MKKQTLNSSKSPKSYYITLILFIFFCYLGLHKIYVGRFKAALYLIFIQLVALTLISVKIIIIATKYKDTSHNSALYFYNIIGTIGYIFFILAILILLKDISQIIYGNFLDKNGKKVQSS